MTDTNLNTEIQAEINAELKAAADQSPESLEKIAKKTVKSTAWTYTSYLLSKGVNLLATAVLARLLSDAQFGIVAFAVTAMSFLDAVRDLGLEVAVIQRKEDVKEFASTAYWFGLITNTVVWVITVLISPLVANFFNEPLITIILPVLSFSFVIGAYGTVYDALLKREMHFSERMIPSISEAVVKGIVSIGLALSGAGVWALVIGQLAGRAAFSIIVQFLTRRIMAWRPQLRWSKAHAKEMFTFGYKISLDSLLSALQANVDYLFIGRFLGDAQLGLYFMAYRLPELIIINLCIVIAQVLLSTFAKLQHDLDQLRRGMLAALRYVSLITIPAGIGMALLASPIVRTFWGDKWMPSILPMALLSLYGAVLTVSWNIGDVYKAIGRPDILWKTTFVEFAMLAPVLYFAAQESIVAVSVGHLSVAILVTLLRLFIATRLLQIPFGQVIHQFIPSIVGTGLMAVAVLAVVLLTTNWPSALVVITGVIVGGLAYLAALWYLERDLVLKTKATMIGMFSPKKQTVEV